MLNTAKILGTLIFFAAFAGHVFAQSIAAEDGPGTPSIMPLAEVKEGARGVAKTVFRGAKSEEFNVEILGVVPNAIGPKQDMIIGRLSGSLADRTMVFAGMSGSPVYIEGRLVGAVSYSFPFSKEAICGITPIEQMLSIFAQASASPVVAQAPQKFTSTELLADHLASRWADNRLLAAPLVSGMASDSRLMAVAGQTFQPIATPLTFSGISQSVLDTIAPELSRSGIIAVAAAGGGSPITGLKTPTETTLLGGDSVMVYLARGDVSIAAAGTVTLRDGNKIYAFGHPFFSLGTTSLPMSESHVVTVIPNMNNSFKLAVPDSAVGVLTQDRATGIYGTLGQAPKMLPVKLHITTSRGRHQEIAFESVFDPFLSPLIVNVGILNSISSNERGVGDSTIEVSGEIRVAGEQPIRIDRRVAGGNAPAVAAVSAAVPLQALLKSNFKGMNVTGIDLNLSVIDGSKTATVERITVDRTQVKAGETVELTAYARTEAGATLVQKIPVTIPKDAQPGQLSLAIGDGVAIQQGAAVLQFIPKTAGELIRNINSLKRPDRLYVVVSRTSAGAIIGSNEMPNLPPSMLATINNDRSAGGSKASVQTILTESEVAAGDYITTGQQTLSIEVVK